MIIHASQMKAFSEAAERRFADELAAHLSKLFPRLYGKIGDPGLREVIQHGVRRAREYGIVRERDVGRYIAVTMMFGPNFDKKRSSGEMYSVLRDPRFKDSRSRTNALCECALRGLRSRVLRTGRKPCW